MYTVVQNALRPGTRGLVAKRLDSRYETGLRTGAWQKMRITARKSSSLAATLSVRTCLTHSLVFGYYEGNRLMCAGQTRNGFTPNVRWQLFKKFRGRTTSRNGVTTEGSNDSDGGNRMTIGPRFAAKPLVYPET
jgi:ATP-dependent DNA ligase